MIDEPLLLVIPDDLSGIRLDQALARLCPQYSRARLQHWIKAGRVLVDGETAKQRDLTVANQQVHVSPVAEPATTRWQAEDIALDVLHEDDDIIILNKPPGLVVHPGAGNPAATLVNALLYHRPELANLPRAGIVHRLDKDTSGIMVVAASMRAHTALVAAIQERLVKREYRAIVHGEVTAGGRIDKPVGRHPTRRTRMAVRDDGKPAITHYRVRSRFRGMTELGVELESGRTHQIRVHLSSIRHPVVGDPLYSGRNRLPGNIPAVLREKIQAFPRQALHADKLALAHPASGAAQSWTAPVASDYLGLLDALADAAG